MPKGKCHHFKVWVGESICFLGEVKEHKVGKAGSAAGRGHWRWQLEELQVQGEGEGCRGDKPVMKGCDARVCTMGT